MSGQGNQARRAPRPVAGPRAGDGGAATGAELDRELGAGRSVTIGDVITLLRPEFPDVTISKIRFLEDQGLVEPDRTPAGYRKFDRGHVERLRAVLTLQRDHYLPLRVIRDVLGTNGSPPDLTLVPDADVATGGAVRHGGPNGRDGGSPVRRDRAWLVDASGASADLVRELEEHNLLDGTRDGRFDLDDLETVRAAVGLAAHGLSPRHLRSLRMAADREADLAAGVVAPLAATRGGTERAADVRREVAASLLRMHAALVACRMR